MGSWLFNRYAGFALLILLVMIAVHVPAAQAQLGDMDVHGFASQGFMGSTGYNYITPSINGSWSISEYAINVGTDVSDNMRVGMQVFARNLGQLSDNSVGIDWAFGDYHWKDELGVRAGRLKMPYGLYNESADFDATRTSILMPQGVYDLRMRDFRMAVNGVNPYGRFDLGSGGSMEWAAMYGIVVHPEDGGSVRTLYIDYGLPFKSITNKRSAIGQLVWNTPLRGLRLGHTFTNYNSVIMIEFDAGTAAYLGINPLQKLEYENLNLNTTSAEYTRGNLQLVGEYNTWIGDAVNPIIGYKLEWENWYLQSSYRFNRWFEMGSYYSVHYADRRHKDDGTYDPDYAGWQKDLALSMRFDITPNMIFKLEGHRIDGLASIMSTNNNEGILADPTAMDQDWYVLASKLSFVF